MAEVYELTRIYRNRLLRRERRVLAEMLRDWRLIERDLIARATAVGEKIEQAALAGTPVEPAWLFQQERAEELLRQARLQMERLADTYTPRLLEEARAAALDGATLAARQLSVSTSFATALSTEAVEFLAASTRVGPLARLLVEVDLELTLRNSLVKGIARGANPREVAREVAGAINATKQRTLTIARTEMARAQRQATYNAYRTAGVSTWQWLSAQDASTCAACWAMDGETFENYEEVDDHPNGRCAIVPVTEGVSLAEVPNRDQAWAALSESDKLRVLGPSRYDLVSRGEVGLGDLATMRTSAEWGTSVGVAPLTALPA